MLFCFDSDFFDREVQGKRKEKKKVGVCFHGFVASSQRLDFCSRKFWVAYSNLCSKHLVELSYILALSWSWVLFAKWSIYMSLEGKNLMTPYTGYLYFD